MLVEGEFVPLVVDNFRIWTKILCSIARISIVRNGLSTGKAFHHLVATNHLWSGGEVPKNVNHFGIIMV